MKAKNFLFVSWESLSGDVAWRVQKEGHHVRAYIDRKDDSDVYDGLLEKVKKWKDQIDWADIVVFDDVGFGQEADQLRRAGKKVVGGSEYTDRLEDDREFGQSEMKDTGLQVLPHWDFENFHAGIKFIRENPGRYVFKPSGKAQSNKDLLFIGEEDEGNDILELLESNKNQWREKIKTFQLQKFAAGVEIAVGAFFNGQEFITPVNINFEHKRMFPGDLGPLTGDMGALMFWAQPNGFFNNTLAKMAPKIAASGYVGYLDLNCIVNGRGIYPLEFTSRFGYPTIDVQLSSLEMPIGEFLYRLASKEKFEILVKKGFRIGICCVTSPYLSEDPADIATYRDLSILFRRPNPDWEGIHLGDVKMVDGQLRVAGTSGYSLVVSGGGNTVDEARRQAYNRVKNIRLQNMFYRVDIGERWLTDSDLLQTWGYLK
ncbi:MAG: phosphoribosylglycinamide synthetase C domain-containing protein [Patescibacteria group bacterium]